MKRFSYFVLALAMVSGLLVHAADTGEHKESLADILSHDIPRLVPVSDWERMRLSVAGNSNLLGLSQEKKPGTSQRAGGKTALHELLLKFSYIKQDGQAFKEFRYALVEVLLNRVKAEKGEAEVRQLIQTPTASSDATVREILDFYGSDPLAQYHYEDGEADALRLLLDQYDPSEQAVDQGAMQD